MIKYVIVCPNANVDLKNGTTGIDILCGAHKGELMFWRDPRCKHLDIVMFDDRKSADAFIIQNRLPKEAFSYGIDK